MYAEFATPDDSAQEHAAKPADQTYFSGQEDVPEAEAIPDPPSPLSFGMRALLALTAVAGIQFALMANLGPMAGLIAGVAVCALIMAGLMIATIVMGLRPGSGLLDRMDQLAIRLVVGIVVLIFGTIIAGGGQLMFSVLEEARFHWRMQQELGFTYQQQYVWDGQDHRNVLAVQSITAGDPMGQAGVKTGDVIFLQSETPEQFLRKLDELRGQSIELTIASYNAGGGVQTVGTKRQVSLQVPP